MRTRAHHAEVPAILEGAVQAHDVLAVVGVRGSEAPEDLNFDAARARHDLVCANELDRDARVLCATRLAPLLVERGDDAREDAFAARLEDLVPARTASRLRESPRA